MGTKKVLLKTTGKIKLKIKIEQIVMRNPTSR
jgi:hypothetical protein